MNNTYINLYINRTLVKFDPLTHYVMQGLDNNCLQPVSYHKINTDELKHYSACYTSGNRYSLKGPGDFIDQHKIIMISEINTDIRVVILPTDKVGTGEAGYHFELNDIVFSPAELIKKGFENVIFELRAIAFKKAFNINYFDNLLDQINPNNQPMNKTDFYHWMVSGNYKDNVIENKLNYLQSKGFIKGKDKINKENINKLKWIADQYFRDYIKPKLELGLAEIKTVHDIIV